MSSPRSKCRVPGGAVQVASPCPFPRRGTRSLTTYGGAPRVRDQQPPVRDAALCQFAKYSGLPDYLSGPCQTHPLPAQTRLDSSRCPPESRLLTKGENIPQDVDTLRRPVRNTQFPHHQSNCFPRRLFRMTRVNPLLPLVTVSRPSEVVIMIEEITIFGLWQYYLTPDSSVTPVNRGGRPCLSKCRFSPH